MNVTVPIYQRKRGTTLEWTTLGLGLHTCTRSGAHVHKLEQALVDDLRRKLEALPPRELIAFELKRGTQLVRARLELVLKGGEKKRKISGLFPLIVEPHVASESERFLIAYHPARQGEWFQVHEGDIFDDQATAFLSHAWAALDDDQIPDLVSQGRDSIKVLSFSAKPRTVLDQLAARKKGIWDDLKPEATRGSRSQPSALKVLPRIATDQTLRATSGASGLPRSPYREQLQGLLGAARKQSTLVVGSPGVGKTTILRQWIFDLATIEDFPSHRNLDRVHHVWQTSGRQIIAGMSYVGDWEQRCVDLLEDVRPRKVILLVSDLHLFGQIGRTRDSERSLADFFRAPLARGEIVLVGECTPAQLRRLEEDAPSFAALFTRLRVHPTGDAETFRMMVHEARALELSHHVEFEAHTFRTTLELCRTLLSSRGLPGSALDVVRRLAADHEGTRVAPRAIGSEDAFAQVSAQSGVPRVLLEREAPLAFDGVEEAFRRQVLGQPEAVSAAADLVVRMRERLVDPRRPYGVYLFTGPTGTGKTELAKCIAEYLYGAASRLLRFDMSEYASGDAVPRLIGDAWSPEGVLTRAVLETPFSVILLDEIEKAHPSVHNLLLQLFDEGRLTDAAGNTATFQHTVVILTSNLGSKARPAVGFGVSADAVMRDIARAVREFFAPELFNRIDHIVPFRPLSDEIAMGVVQKELAKLLSRRGLTDRNIFVRTTDGVLDHVRREAFRAEDGARSLKRYLEDAIGSRLSEEIVRAPAAAMQVMTLFEADGELAVAHDRLVEATQVAARFALEPIMGRPTSEVREHLPALVPILDAIESSGGLELLSERIRFHLGEHNLGRREHGALLYNLDWMRNHAAALRERVERVLIQSRSLAYDEIERRQFRYENLGDKDSRLGGRFRLFGPDQGPDDRIAPRRELLECLAETYFLRRAIAHAHDEGQHAVFLEVVRVGASAPRRFAEAENPGRTLLAWLTRAYASARGELDALAAVVDGVVVDGLDRAALDDALAKGTSHVVLKVVGPCVRGFFELDAGTHVWHSLAAAPEIVRVRVIPAERGVTARALVLRHREARAAFEQDPARENPLALTPIARVVRFEPPRAGSAPSRLEMDDYVLGYSGASSVRALSEALAPLWLLRLSREDAP